ncbi:MAG TPA: SUMF1/EgtB/PvdO family nonheme iron enzyme [Candidatus Acidoferrales bacterium]|nr:SUMF1/EgtB/PvdO family nonheme iron enzyme [Candidatus Acidoferrales bacterium]
MATSRLAPQLHPTLLSRLSEARARTDALFELLPPNSFYDRPIPERHRLIFYLGHLEAFDWNLFAPYLELESRSPAFDRLFAFGIDPVGGSLPTDAPGDWPNIANIEKYNRRVRERLDEELSDVRASHSSVPEIADGTLLHVAIEHRLMHAETLAYLLHNLPVERKIPRAGPLADARPAPKQRQVTIPAGVATLGQSRTMPSPFGWDNEFGEVQLEVPSFSIDAFPVTNGEYLKFLRAGGYENSAYWRPEDWEWRRRERLDHPHLWVQRSSSPPTDPDTQWGYRAMFGTIPLPPAWPVYVSHAEATAFARWSGRRLPTETQWHRAAYAAPDGIEREFPWGNAPPDRSRGNFHHERWGATTVDTHPSGASAFGVFDLIGNGWEWTSTVFGPFPGFERFSFYPGYSADFFDGRHFVMKGGSPRTDVCMLRRSFRNWFQPHYPHVYATFRCVEE